MGARVERRAGSRLTRAAALFGPAFVASVAYIDPGNVATNVTAGAEQGYRLAWVIVAASVAAMLVQHVSAKVGIASGSGLPALCRERYGRRLNVLFWLQAELVVMATDLAEFVGAAVGLDLLLGVPLFPAALITAVVSVLLLGVDRSRRRFELLVVALLGVVLGSLLYTVVVVGHFDAGALAAGTVPRLGAGHSTQLAVGIVGATVMPHVIYLHSALHVDRAGAGSTVDKRRLVRFSGWDCVIGLGLAGVGNVLLLCLAADLFAGRHTSGTVGLAAVHADLGRVVGGGAALAFALALLTSGVVSASVGTYSGQVVMAGFVGLRLPVLVRRIVTMVPPLAVVAVAHDPTQALVISQVVLSFGIPFALVPLVLISRDRAVMQDLTNRRLTTGLLAAVTVLISVLDAYLVVSLITGA